MEKIARRILPQGMKYQWTALSYQEKLTGAATIFVFALAMLLAYFVLAGQYESWILPLAVIFAIPLAALGTVLSLRLTGLPNNLYVQIGLVLLIALSAKNAILVVEMARQRREAGCSILTAAVEGARLRFRPILMTSFTFILGVAPLILATGAGTASRQSLRSRSPAECLPQPAWPSCLFPRSSSSSSAFKSAGAAALARLRVIG